MSRHPILGVVVCRPCRGRFFSGRWTRDDDGYFEHCRWCAEGGSLVSCANDE